MFTAHHYHPCVYCTFCFWDWLYLNRCEFFMKMFFVLEVIALMIRSCLLQ